MLNLSYGAISAATVALASIHCLSIYSKDRLVLTTGELQAKFWQLINQAT